ncbi:MAG: hypothetical protein JXA57_17065 [Armatimonadetes bacterium]|nr:hypothetical protein [Armatimonadota bacterium]
MVTVYAWLAITALAIHIASGIAMAAQLEKRGERVHWWLIRMLIIKYAARYRQLKLEESGEEPPLFLAYSIGGLFAFGFAVAAIVTRVT